MFSNPLILLNYDDSYFDIYDFWHHQLKKLEG